MVGPEFLRPGDDRDIFVCKFEIEKVHYVKVKDFYTALHDDLRDAGWVDPVTKDDKFEGLYWERVLGDGKKEHNIWWRMVKTPPHGSDYVRFALKVDIQTLMVSDTEIPYKGKKKKTQMADLICRMWFWVQWDYKNKFQKSIVKGLQKTFRRQLYKDEMEQHKLDLYNMAQKLRTWCKDYLDMEELGERPRLFQPERGYQDQF